MTAAPIRLLLADDHRMFRQGLRELLERKTSFTIVGEATTGREALAKVTELIPDIILMDIQMPELDGVAATKTILEGVLPTPRLSSSPCTAKTATSS